MSRELRFILQVACEHKFGGVDRGEEQKAAEKILPSPPGGLGKIFPDSLSQDDGTRVICTDQPP